MLDFTTLDATYEKLKLDIQAYSDENHNTDSGLRCAQSALDGADAGIASVLEPPKRGN